MTRARTVAQIAIDAAESVRAEQWLRCLESLLA
jgi:hypothetical protein